MKSKFRKMIIGVGLAAAALVFSGGLTTAKAADEQHPDWSKISWSPVQGPSPWKEWKFDPKKEGRTWKYFEELTAEEKQYWQIDPRWSHEIPRDKEFPLLPETRYPYKLPYNGEELSSLAESAGATTTMCGLQTHHAYHINRTKDRNGVVSKSDQICNTIKHFKTYAELLYGMKPGTEQGAFLVVLASPPEQAGVVQLSKFYKDGPGVSKVEDRWVYVPTLRRVRRFNGANGQDYLPGSISTMDDIFLRDFWKFDSKIIGVDILYQAANEKKPYGPVDGAYRQDGGVETYVVLNKYKQNGYYLSQWISWHDKKTGHILRTEQWDRKGNFKLVTEASLAAQVEVFGKLEYPWAEAMKGGLNENGNERRSFMMGGGPQEAWDVELDISTYMIPSNPSEKIPYDKFGPLNVYAGGEDWKQLFQPQRIENPFVRPVPVVNFQAKDFPAHPPLYRDKFAKYRKIELPAEIESKIKKEEQGKRGLFGAGN
jgi:hypothetical protein